MATSFTEKYDSRTITTGSDGAAESAEFVYILRGVSGESDARVLATNSTAAAYGALQRRQIEVKPIHIDTTNADACIWDVTVQYGQRDPRDEPEPGDPPVYSFDTTGGTQHITHSKGTIHAVAAKGFAPNFGRAIGVTQNSVEGVDITVPVFNFSETHYRSPEVTTNAYRHAVFLLTGKVNSSPFKGFAAGEVLFLGASGSMRAGENWEINYRFAAMPNAVNLQIGDEITIPSKKGWDYLWVYYGDHVDENAKMLVQRPVAAYVVEVYDYADFSPLGIGT